MTVEEHTKQAYKLAYIEYMEREATIPLSSLGKALIDLGVNLEEYEQEILEERAEERREAARQLAGLWVDVDDLKSSIQDRIWGYGQTYATLEQEGKNLLKQFNSYLHAIEEEQCSLSDEYGV